MQPLPEPARNAAIAQLVSGIVSIFIMMPLLYFGWQMVALGLGVLTLGIGAILGCCGWSACLLLPLGVVEIIAGILGLTNNPAAVTMGRIVAYVEIAAILLGGITTFIAGVVAVIMLNKPEVEAWKAAQVAGPGA
ncbi:MAG: hypothetical protein FJ090_19255 [Deltaproteobacteria bacterium]|nr:hypothetical protein [Deltaproteobacteria bacterium]